MFVDDDATEFTNHEAKIRQTNVFASDNLNAMVAAMEENDGLLLFYARNKNQQVQRDNLGESDWSVK